MDIRIKYASLVRAGWNFSDATSGAPIADLVNFSDQVSTGVALARSPSGTLGSVGISAGGDPGSGDAAWMEYGPFTSDVIKLNSGATLTDTYSGLDNGKTYTVEAFGINSSGPNLLEITAGGQTDSIATAGNLTETAKITGLSPAGGSLAVVYGGTGDQYIGGSRLLEEVAPPGPVAPLDDDILEPGKAMTGTYANFASAPTTVTVTDSGGNSISSATEITDLVVNDTAKTYGFTVPPRRTSGTGKTLLRGQCTVELT